MKEESGERLQDEPDAPEEEERRTWVERQLGDGWIEVEPGIYRFTGPGSTASRPSENVESPRWN